MAKKGTRKAERKDRKRKTMKGGKRTLSPALKEWNRKVMEKFREMKRKNPSTRLGDAMKALKAGK